MERIRGDLEVYVIGPGLPGFDADPMTYDEAVELVLSRSKTSGTVDIRLRSMFEPQTVTEKYFAAMRLRSGL